MATTEQKLRVFLQDIAKKENYVTAKIDIKPITSGGANYTTDLYLATISEPLKPNIDIFAKAANLSEDARKNNEFLTRVYETEATFYTELAVNFDRIYNEHQVPAGDRLVIPKYYGHLLIPQQEILVLENLETKGFQNFDRMKTFNWEYAATAVTQMAKLHALGLSFRGENQAEFEKIVSNFYIDFTKNQDMINAFIQMGIQNGCEAVNGDHKQRLLNYFSSMDDLTAKMSIMMDDQTMLIHGDFRPSNLMHRRRNGKLEIIPLDYQTLKMGNPVIDLIYFIFSGSDEEFRRLHYQRLLDHYFTRLTLELRQLNVDVENVYPRNRFDTDLISVRPVGLLLALMMIGMVTVAPEKAPTISSDVSSMQVKPNELAQERIRGIVRDFVRWGVL